MKKLFALTLLLASFITVQDTFAQIKAGGGLVFGSEISQLGIDIRGEYHLDENWVIVPNINFFFADKETIPAIPPLIPETEIKQGLTTINFDAHYLVPMNDDRIDLYPLAGLNFSIVSDKVNDVKNSETKVGLNLGGGGQFEFSELLTGFAEIKYVINDFDQLVIGAGVLVNLTN